MQRFHAFFSILAVPSDPPPQSIPKFIWTERTAAWVGEARVRKSMGVQSLLVPLRASDSRSWPKLQDWAPESEPPPMRSLYQPSMAATRKAWLSPWVRWVKFVTVSQLPEPWWHRNKKPILSQLPSSGCSGGKWHGCLNPGGMAVNGGSESLLLTLFLPFHCGWSHKQVGTGSIGPRAAAPVVQDHLWELSSAEERVDVISSLFTSGLHGYFPSEFPWIMTLRKIYMRDRRGCGNGEECKISVPFCMDGWLHMCRIPSST